MDADVVIAGAGPAGTATAKRLVDLSGGQLRILVLDRHRFPRDKPCGGALTGRMVEAMEQVGLKLSVDSAPCDKGLVRYGSFERVVQMGRPVQIVRRSELDHSFLQQAEAAGACIVQGEGVVRYQVDEEGVRVETSRGRSLTACVLVGADGVASVVRKELTGGQRGTPHRLFAAELARPASVGTVDTMTYDFSLMSEGLRGYLWLFPVPGGRVNVGLMHYPSRHEPLSGRPLMELLRRGLRRYGVELPDHAARGWPVWGYHPKAVVSAPRVLTVGDAAGIDGLTGEGIAVALEQAALAAQMICEAFDAGQFGFADYRRRLRKATVGRELALDRWLASLLYGGRRWRDWLSLVLFDPAVIEMYARRVDGTDILADRKPALYRALGRHVLARRRRRRTLDASVAS